MHATPEVRGPGSSCVVRMNRLNFEKIGVQFLEEKLKFISFLKVWTVVSPTFESDTCTTKVVLCHVAYVAFVLGRGKSAVFNGLLFV